MLNDFLQIEQVAQWYTSHLHLPIIPLCSPNHSGMSSEHINKCRSPGKTPIIKNWTARQTPLLKEVKQWYCGQIKPNVGLILGKSDKWNLVGIDIDGAYGEEILILWSQQDLPTTWEFPTANGRRLLYSLPPDLQTKKIKNRDKNQKHQELALLVSGQQTVLPPSIHHTGFAYCWKEGCSPEDIDIAEAPDWLVKKIQIQNREGVESEPLVEEDWTEPIIEGGRNTHLARLTGTLIAKKNVPKDQVLAFVKMWNTDHCKPPLPEVEIESMVEAIYLSEKNKDEKRKSTPTNRPSQAAIQFLEAQQAAGWLWRYTSTRGAFYRTHLYRGPWKSLSEELVVKLLAEELVPLNDSLDTTHKLNQVFKALQRHLTVDEEVGAIDDVFNMGKYPDLRYIQVENGMLEWRTGKLLPWDPQTLSTLQMNASYTPDLDREQELQLWNTTLQQWIPDSGTIDFLQEFIGYCLVPSCDFRTAVFLIGGGRNGKSLFLDTVASLFKDHLSVVPMERISDRFETSQFMDSLINLCADVDIGYLPSTGTLKSLIAGDDMRAEYKFGKTFKFRPVTRYIFSANNLPKTRDKSEGWMSRWKFVSFPNTFDVSPSFKTEFLETMTSESGRQALLLWAVEGLQRLYLRKSFSNSTHMIKEAKAYQHENDNVMAFLDGVLVRVTPAGSGTSLVLSVLYNTYRQWTLITGSRTVAQTEFNKRLLQLGYEKGPRIIRGKSYTVVLGVAINPGFPELDVKTEYHMQLSMLQSV